MSELMQTLADLYRTYDGGLSLRHFTLTVYVYPLRDKPSPWSQAPVARCAVKIRDQGRDAAPARVKNPPARIAGRQAPRHAMRQRPNCDHR